MGAHCRVGRVGGLGQGGGRESRWVCECESNARDLTEPNTAAAAVLVLVLVACWMCEVNGVFVRDTSII